MAMLDTLTTDSPTDLRMDRLVNLVVILVMLPIFACTFLMLGDVLYAAETMDHWEGFILILFGDLFIRNGNLGYFNDLRLFFLAGIHM